jgi:hypothetical protein
MDRTISLDSAFKVGGDETEVPVPVQCHELDVENVELVVGEELHGVDVPGRVHFVQDVHQVQLRVKSSVV